MGDYWCPCSLWHIWNWKKNQVLKASYPSAEDKRGVMVASHGSFVFPYFYRQLKFSGRLYFSRKAFYYYLSQTWKLSMFSLKGKKKEEAERRSLPVPWRTWEKERDLDRCFKSRVSDSGPPSASLFFFLKTLFCVSWALLFLLLAGSFLSRKK